MQPVETNLIINEAGVQQPQKSIGEMLDELPKGNSRNKHIEESNIIVSTPVFDHIACSMKTKTTAEFKEKELQKREARAPKKGVGRGAGSAPKRNRNQLPVEEEDGVYPTLQVKLWPSRGRPRVVGNTTLSQQWLQLQLSQLKLLKMPPLFEMGKVEPNKPARSCPQFH